MAGIVLINMLPGLRFGLIRPLCQFVMAVRLPNLFRRTEWDFLARFHFSLKNAMPISAQCDSCSAKLKVRDELAGKRVKCPKCQKPFRIPGQAKAPQPTPARKPAAAAAAARTKPSAADDYSLAPPEVPAPRSHNPLLDLLDEAGVESAARGAVCINCGADLKPQAIICVECGYNNETGKQLETTVVRDNEAIEEGKSDADRMLAKAEKEIDDMPVSAADQDFGDGADSMIIALIALIGAVVLAGLGVGTIFVMDKIGENIDTAWISFCGAVAIYLFCAIWITVIAFRAKPLHGLGCLFSGGLYAIVFGFMQGKALLMPTLICVFAILIGAVSFLMSG